MGNKNTALDSVHVMLVLHWKEYVQTPVHSYRVEAKIILQARDRLP